MLAQVFEEGYGIRETDQVRLSWAEVYRLLDNEAYKPSLHLLGLPPAGKIRPSLSSKESLLDTNFAVVVSGWVGESSVPLPSTPRIVGAIASVGGVPKLLEEGAWLLLCKVAAFHQRSSDERTPEANRRWWGEIRKAAQAAHAPLSDFLQKTIVLTPDKLHLDLRKAGDGEAKTIEVTPTFGEAPDRWIEMFDRFAIVPERYDIPNGQELVSVVVTPEVRSVLSEIKRMPGRRVSGSRAEAFVRNPFALLGVEAATVIDADDFEKAREAAHLSFQRFSPAVRRNAQQKIAQVLLVIEDSASDGGCSDEYVFESPDKLGVFIEKLTDRLARDSQCCFWKGYELEILGDTPEHLTQLRQAFEEWVAPSHLSMAEVFRPVTLLRPCRGDWRRKAVLLAIYRSQD